MPNKCCVFKCYNTRGFKFPKDSLLLKKWLIAVKRKNWITTENSVVCENHFLLSDFLDGPKANGTLSRKLKWLKKDAVPTVFAWSKTTNNSALLRDKRNLNRQTHKPETVETHKPETVETHRPETIDIANADCSEVILELEIDSTCLSKEDCEEMTGTSTSQLDVSVQVNLIPKSIPLLSVEVLQNNQKLLHYYTGLESFSKFKRIFWTLGPAVNDLNYLRTGYVKAVSPINQFLLMLARLRQDVDYVSLAHLCGVSEYTAQNIFITWINFCSRQWAEIITWPDKDLVQFFSPSDFKKKYPSTRVIVDSTEIPIQRPSNPVAQRASFSSYKNKNTVKVVVGATPGGLVCYTSEVYGGSASDRQIIERSTLPDFSWRLCNGR